jgi:hypothetical protein
MKITTLIPAYKPKYLVDLLTALRHQTHKPDRIIFSDDSPDQAFVRALQSEPLRSVVADLPIEVIEGPHQGGWANFLHLLKVWDGSSELFHFLLDDDVIYPNFYARHLHAHQSTDTLCSVSRRWTALESGHPVRDLPVPATVDQHPHRLLSLPASVLFATTAARNTNWLGEYSNTVLRAEFAPEVHATALDGISYIGLEDLGAFLCASLHKPVSYINEHLGYFRINAEQHSAQPMGRAMKAAHLAYLALAIGGRRVGQLSAEQAHEAVAALAPLIVQRYGAQADMAHFCEVMPSLASGSAEGEAAFLQRWALYTAPNTAPTTAPNTTPNTTPPAAQPAPVLAA